MTKIPQDLRGPEGQAIRPTDLDGEQTLGVTLTSVEDFKGQDGQYFVARFEEMPGLYLRLNKTSIGRLIAGFKSDDTDDWRGKVSLEIVKTEDPRDREKGTVTSVWVAAVEDWPEKPKPAGRGSRKAAAK